MDDTEKLLELADKAMVPSDFKDWTTKDLGKVAAVLLARYFTKAKTKKDWQTIIMIYHWACHASHDVSAMMGVVFREQNINPFKELRKWNTGYYG